MSSDQPEETLELPRVEVMRLGDVGMLCIIGARLIWIPYGIVLVGTEVAHRGDRGRLIIPRHAAAHLGIMADPSLE